MTSEVVVWAQADVLTVRTALVPTGQASKVETLLLKAIQAGADRVADLCDVFGLAPRLVEDVLGDLWRAGQISIDLGTEREMITLTSSARDHLRSIDEGGDAASAASRTGSEEVAHDRLTGRVLPLHATRINPRDRHLVVPTMLDDPQAADLTEAELAEAVSRTLVRRSAGDRPADVSDDEPADHVEGMRIDAVYLAPALLQPSKQRRYVPLRVNAVKDATGALSVRVIDEKLPLRTRKLVARRLQGLIAERPTARFATQLRSVAQRAPLRDPDLGQLVAELQRTVNALPGCQPANRQRAHDQAARRAQDIVGYCRSAALNEMNVEVIATADEHIAALTRMLAHADRQVVIAAPWLRPAGVLGIRDALIAAVERGIQVAVLWGINTAAEPLDVNVLAMFAEIQQHARRADRGGSLRYHRERGARSHAKIAVRDDRELLVTSKNFLSDSNRAEVGVLLRVPDALGSTRPLASPVIEAALQFIYNHTPDPAMAFQLIRTRGAFGSRRDDPLLPPVPMPRLTATLLSPSAPPGHVEAWAAAWQETARVLTVLAVGRRPTVEVITDGQHAALVRDALEGARQRVLVTSDRVTSQALTAEVSSLAQARAAEGVDVALRYGRVMDDASEQRLTQLGEGTGAHLTDARRVSGMHAKVVVCDSTTIVGSFNHLSVNAGVRGLRATGELSVRITSAAVAEEISRALLGRPPQVSPSGEVDDTTVAPAEAILPQLLIDLLEPPDGPPDVDALAELVTTHGAPAMLGTARRLQLSARAEQRILAAAALPTLAGANVGKEERLAALLHQVWDSGGWGCAELLRRNISDPDLSPRATLTSALADPLGRPMVVFEAVAGERDLTDAEAEALAVSTAVGLLLGEQVAPELVELLRGWARKPAHTDELVTAAVDYWARYGPLPVDMPNAAATADNEAELGALRRAVEAAVESLRRYDTHSDSGDAVRDFLFTPEGEMSKLVAALSEDDCAGIQAWEETHSDSNDSRWLTKTAKAANQPPINDHRRRSFIEKHRAIREALRALNVAVAEDMKRREVRIQLSAEQLVQIRDLTVLAVPASIPGRTPEQTAISLTVARLRARLTGDAGADRLSPTVSLRSWALPQARVALLSAAPDQPTMAELLDAVCRDLAAGWCGPEAVRHLLAAGEYGLAGDSIAQLRTQSRIDAATADSLRWELKAARARVADQLDARTRALWLRCEQVGLDGAETRWGNAGILGDRRAEAFARWLKIDEELAQEIEVLKKAAEERLAACRDQLHPEWFTHIENLIKKDELSAAALALTPSHRNSRHLLPQPVRLSLWSWRADRLADVAAWLAPDGGEMRPKGVREFVPDPLDTEAAGVVAALHGLANDSPQALVDWLAAVQALVVETDVPPVVQPLDDGGAAAVFVLPYDVRLPRLRWVGRAPEPVTVGAVSQRAALHFSLESNDHRAGMAVINVSDILSLLGRDPSGQPASRTTRALLFLSTVCSQLPLEQVIAARDTPAEHAVERRMALAWLLHILGFAVTATDLDRLRVLGGGHQVPLWHLIDAARENPVDGISRLWDRPDRDEILHAGLAADLDSETDLLALSTLLRMDAEDRAALATALELVWADAGVSQEALAAIDLDVAIDRLIKKGYLREVDGQLLTCACPVVRAQHRRSNVAGETQRLVQRVHATLEVRDLLYRDLLHYAWHADQAETALRSKEEKQATARRAIDARMSDRTPFDMRLVCTEAARRADLMREDVDVYWESRDGEPAWVAGPEAPYAYLVRELLTNAISAVGQSGESESACVWLSLQINEGTMTLVVSDNGPGFPDDFHEAFAHRHPLVRPDRPDRGNVFHKLRLYAEENGARFELGEREGGGAVTVVHLPLVTRIGQGNTR